MPAAHPFNNDPFKKARERDGVMKCPFAGEQITMLLRHQDVRDAAADWQKFSSDAPFRVPIPSEEDLRSVRQLPIEIDPPQHKQYRDLTQPFFLRAKKKEVIAAVKAMIEEVVGSMIGRPSFDAVSEFALPIQSRAFTYLLDMPESEAEIWIRWGIHVFRPQDDGTKPGDSLEKYLNERLDLAQSNPGKDFFSALTQAEFNGRKLTRDECLGFANLAFAGGRDTIIHSITCIIAWLGENPDGLAFLREDPKRITLASEEFFRVFMPLTLIGRVCPEGTTIHGVEVQPGERVGLCWVSANYDESVFKDAQQVKLDRRPNPHVAFGFRDHLCQGAAHARLVIRSMLEVLCEKEATIKIIDYAQHLEQTEKFTRAVGFESLNVAFEK